MKKWLFSIITFTLSLVGCGTMAFFGVLFLAGPHGGVLPTWTSGLVLLMGWIFALGVPIHLALKVYKAMRVQ